MRENLHTRANHAFSLSLVGAQHAAPQLEETDL